MPSSLPSVRALVAAGLGTGVIVASGVGAAAAGALPGAAQDTARSWLSTVGVDVPGANERAAGLTAPLGSTKGSAQRLLPYLEQDNVVGAHRRRFRPEIGDEVLLRRSPRHLHSGPWS